MPMREKGMLSGIGRRSREGVFVGFIQDERFGKKWGGPNLFGHRGASLGFCEENFMQKGLTPVLDVVR
jgi:hypothetical protein